MSRKEGFCESCQQNKAHRRIAGVFSLLNLLLLGIPSLFGISTWQCTHCRSFRIFLFRQRGEAPKKARSSFKRALPTTPPNGGLKLNAPEKTETPRRVAKSTRSRLYSEKYRDGVVKRIVSGIASIKEVQDSLELPETDVVDWIKQSFQRKEDRVEELREVLTVHKKDNPEFDVEQVMLDVAKIAKARSVKVESSKESPSKGAPSKGAPSAESPAKESPSKGPRQDGDHEPIQRTFNRTVKFLDSASDSRSVG